MNLKRRYPSVVNILEGVNDKTADEIFDDLSGPPEDVLADLREL